MNGHLEQWLDAYRDGELNDSQIRHAEAHLEGCPACRAELEQRRALSALLRAEPSVEGFKNESRFVAEIGLRLQRKPAARRGTGPGSVFVWGMIPIALILVWVFVQTAVIVSGVVELIPGAGELVTEGLSAEIPPIAMPEFVRDGLLWMGAPGLGGWAALSCWMILLALSLLFTGWFAGWWVSQRASGSLNGR